MGGQTAARAAGIHAAKAEWIYFLDADDKIMPDTLSSMYSHIDSDTDVLVYETQLIGKLNRLQYCRELLSFRSWWLCGKLWRRSLFDDRVMNGPKNFRTGEDFAMQMRLLKNIQNYVMCIPEHKYIYDENSPTSARSATYKDYEYEKQMILEVESALACIEEDVTDDLRRWELVYLSGMMGLRYDIKYGDEWIVRLKDWSRRASLSPREKLAIKAIDIPLYRKTFVIEKCAKRVARRIINKVKSFRR